MPLYCALLAQLDRAVTYLFGVTGWRFESSTGNYFKQTQLEFKMLVVLRNQNTFTPHALRKQQHVDQYNGNYVQRCLLQQYLQMIPTEMLQQESTVNLVHEI
ncbi:Hypothetical_protein [Hexamita inflata]|uniref:Hypothetical_protein n=1 Tax=Hexamita inflata TaxID=28002 RepID=A0AA86P2L5_9EUKA|nr:Hypothetical protein HINF_LOCUS17260 [Hexamita inflata]